MKKPDDGLTFGQKKNVLLNVGIWHARVWMLLFTKAPTAGPRWVNSPQMVAGGLMTTAAYGMFSGSEIMLIVMFVAIGSQIEQSVRTRSHGQHSYDLGDNVFFNLWFTGRNAAWNFTALVALALAGFVYAQVEAGEFARKELAAAWWFGLSGLSQWAVFALVHFRQQREAEDINDAVLAARERQQRVQRMGRD